MKILIAAPCVYPVMPPSLGGYLGMERLAALITKGMVDAGHEVSVIAARGSQVDSRATLYEASSVGSFEESELMAWREHEWALDHTDVVLDLSHSHYFRTNETPGISWIWHDPRMMTPPVPGSNVAALSGWQAERFMQTTGQDIRVIDCICADETVCFYDPEIEVGDRYISIGIVDENKGQLQAAQLAQELDIGLDIIGKAVDMSLVTKLMEIERDTGGKVKYHGEVFGSTKMDMLKRSRGLIYTPNYPEGMGEAHSHKAVEALMSGVPCFLKEQGAAAELFEGLAFVGELADLKEAEASFFGLPLRGVANQATSRWRVPSTTLRLLEALVDVIGGDSW